MNNMEVEILLVEDNVYDAEMTVRALKRVNLAKAAIPTARSRPITTGITKSSPYE